MHNQGINARNNEQGINKSMYYSLYNTLWNKVLVKTKMHVQFYCDAYLQLATCLNYLQDVYITYSLFSYFN